MSTRIRFENETKGNSEMAYCKEFRLNYAIGCYMIFSRSFAPS